MRRTFKIETEQSCCSAELPRCFPPCSWFGPMVDTSVNLLECIKTGAAGFWSSQKKTAGSNFEVLPRRWIVERTLAWLESSRRLTSSFALF